MIRQRALAALSPFALAALAAAQDAYMVDSNLDQLFSVNVTTGVATLIGSTLNNGLSTPADLTWRAATQQLWTIDLSGGEIGTINVTDGTFTPVFTANPTSGWQAMAWHETDGVFYLANQNGSNLPSCSAFMRWQPRARNVASNNCNAIF